jgi:hypothetical protein
VSPTLPKDASISAQASYDYSSLMKGWQASQSLGSI